jgi:glutamate 5-kinase
MLRAIKDKKRIVIKIGSSLLIKEGKVRTAWLKSLAEDITKMKEAGQEVIIVSSGAIALGKTKLRIKSKNLTLAEKQAAAAIGQIALMANYQACFAKFGLNVAQILITGDDASDRNRYLNARNTINTLLKNNVIPIVNENDTIAVEEIKIGDNDRLAARIAQIAVADLLILLSDIDGLYDSNPKTNKNAKFIFLVENIDKTIEEMAGGAGSDVGTGGMITKIKAAKMAFNLGCDCIIASGLKPHPIARIFYPELRVVARGKIREGSLIKKSKFTLFKAGTKKINSKKQWIADCLNSKGEVVINQCAVEALQKNSSLLPIGIVQINGEFKKGEVIFIKDEQGNHLASGIAKYSAVQAKLVLGKNNQEELVHKDDLVLL